MIATEVHPGGDALDRLEEALSRAEQLSQDE